MSQQEPDAVLNAVRNFVSTLWWAPEEYLDAYTLLLAVTHVKDGFTSVPYGLFTSDKPQTGKTTVSTDIPMLLADAPWEVNTLTTEPALRAKFMDRVPPATVCAPDVSKLFGESGLNGRTSKVYQLLVAGYRRSGKVEVSVNRVSTLLPAYFVAFMDGLNNAVPGDLATRSVQFRLRPKPPGLRMRDALSVPVAKEAGPLKKALHRWAVSNRRVMQQFMLSGVTRVHPLLTDRRLQLWGPLFAVAHAAGGGWPQRCMSAFLEMALDESDRPVVLIGQQALLDTAKIAMETGAAVLFTADLVERLRGLPDDLYREVDDDYLAGDLLPRALGPSRTMRARALDGRLVTGKARLVAPLLTRAAALEEELNPALKDSGPGETELELTLTEAG
jgi:hypothetical protein